MFGARLVVNFATIVRILGALQNIFHQVYRIIQKVVITFADVYMNFAFQLWSDLGPVAL